MSLEGGVTPCLSRIRDELLDAHFSPVDLQEIALLVDQKARRQGQLQLFEKEAVIHELQFVQKLVRCVSCLEWKLQAIEEICGLRFALLAFFL